MSGSVSILRGDTGNSDAGISHSSLQQGLLYPIAYKQRRIRKREDVSAATSSPPPPIIIEAHYYQLPQQHALAAVAGHEWGRGRKWCGGSHWKLAWHRPGPCKEDTHPNETALWRGAREDWAAHITRSTYFLGTSWAGVRASLVPWSYPVKKWV